MAAQPAGAAAPKRCALPHGAKVERRTHSVLLYSRFAPDRFGARSQQFVACAAGVGRPHVVAAFYAGDSLGGRSTIYLIRVSGFFVALASGTWNSHYSDQTVDVTVSDARSGRRLNALQVASGYSSDPPGYQPRIYGLVLARDGAFAFIARRMFRAPYDWRTVVVAERRMSERQLDQGNSAPADDDNFWTGPTPLDNDNIDRSSLRLDGGTLSWVRDGQRWTAQL